MRYVAGLLFSPDQKQVVILKKARPAWQAGRYNAVGGKIEIGETPLEAMQREFHEETGVQVSSWEEFAFLEASEWECNFFRSWGDVSKCTTQDPEEPIEIALTDEVKLMKPEQVISNVPWLTSLALNTTGGLVFPLHVKYYSTT